MKPREEHPPYGDTFTRKKKALPWFFGLTVNFTLPFFGVIASTVTFSLEKSSDFNITHPSIPQTVANLSETA